MIVLKFGGSSVGSVKNIKKVAEIVKNTKGPKIIVLSAMYGVTDTLQNIYDLTKNDELIKAQEKIVLLKNRYFNIIEELFSNKVIVNQSKQFIEENYIELASLIKSHCITEIYNSIIAQGELVSTFIFQKYLKEIEEKSKLISALDFMRIDKHGEPEMHLIKRELKKIIFDKKDNTIFITQGFICQNEKGKIVNLKRGGSDYSASIIGAALEVDQIQIWTDIDGMHNNDPRYVNHTYSINEISFDEAAELAYFGAKILHPQSIIPAKEANIPVLIKNTFSPDSKGTLIHENSKLKKIRAIAAKDGITAIKIKSYRMLMAYGFLKKIFEVFEAYKTSIDMITTSEVTVSLTIDNTDNLKLIIKELEGFGEIKVDEKLSIICVAGDLAQNNKGITSIIFNGLKNIPIRMISYGGSKYNLSFLVKTTDKIEVLNLLNNQLFPIPEKEEVLV